MMGKKEGRGEKRTRKCTETSIFTINMKRGSLDEPKRAYASRMTTTKFFFLVMSLMGLRRILRPAASA